ncbi:MAG: serine/threonine-protein kinase [Nannocystaceae bacterium]
MLIRCRDASGELSGGTIVDSSLPTQDLDERELDGAERALGGLQLGDVLDESFELTGVLGSGGMGTVYRARDLKLERDVAIKVIHADKLRDERAIGRFLSEARAMARVRHPNVVTIYAFGSRAGQPYLVMEYVPGENLAVWRQRSGPLTPAEAVVVLDPLMAGVQAIHDAGAIHRDLKPSNVLVGPVQRVAVTDFGLARPVERDEVRGSALVVGTPAYLAPELARGDALVPELATRIDIYALAVMAFELLTGRPPFAGPSLTALLEQHGFSEPPAPSQVGTGLPTAFDAPLLQALAKNPADRPPSVELLRTALLSALETSVAAPSGLRILVVDDECSALVAMHDLLQLSFPGSEVITVADPATAISLAHRAPPDVVITDLHMPHGGGAALTRALRQDERTDKVPIVVVTAYGGGSDWRQLRQMGADRFLVKPVDFDTLASVVRSLTAQAAQ